MALLGVRPKDSRDILLNPGLHYILDEDDVCYYVGFTREEYSKVREAPPSAVRTAVWQTCANMALLSLSIAGINTEQLGAEFGAEPAEEVAGEEEEGVSEHSVRFHVGGVNEEGAEPSTSCPISPALSTCELPSSETACPVVKRGLKLLRFHSRLDIHANPVVKVNFCAPSPVMTPEEGEDGSTFELRPPTQFADDIRLVEEGRGLRPLHQPIALTPPMGRRRENLRRSMSESSLTGVTSEPKNHLKSRGIIYSSQLSLVQDQGSKVDDSTQEEAGSTSHAHFFPPLARVLRRMSSRNAHRPSVGTAVVDFKGSQEVSK